MKIKVKMTEILEKISRLQICYRDYAKTTAKRFRASCQYHSLGQGCDLYNISVNKTACPESRSAFSASDNVALCNLLGVNRSAC